MVKLENDRFLTELHKLYERNKQKGTVWVTMKRSELPLLPMLTAFGWPCLLIGRALCLCHPSANEKPRKGKKDYSHLEYKCLVRATDGKRKLSTVVTGKDLGRFHDSYTTILKVRTGQAGRCRRGSGARVLWRRKAGIGAGGQGGGSNSRAASSARISGVVQAAAGCKFSAQCSVLIIWPSIASSAMPAGTY